MISLILIIFAGICNAIMDKVNWHFYRSVFNTPKWFNYSNPEKSWENKWILDSEGHVIKEKFPGSSTIFVFTTDLWHLMQFFLWTFLITSVVLYKPMFTVQNEAADIIIHFVIFRIVFSAIFQLFFSVVLKKR